MNIEPSNLPPRAPKRLPRPPDGETQALLGYMPIIIRAPGISKWERDFCISIVGRMMRGPVSPSEKQIDVMRRLVGKFKEATMRDGDVTE